MVLSSLAFKYMEYVFNSIPGYISDAKAIAADVFPVPGGPWKMRSGIFFVVAVVEIRHCRNRLIDSWPIIPLILRGLYCSVHCF
jgi:hypothetical protein